MWMCGRQLHSEPDLYCLHRGSEVQAQDPIARAQENGKDQHEVGDARHVQGQVYKLGNLLCMLSVHVDDIMGAARKEIAELLLQHFHRVVGQCEADCCSVLHAGVQRKHSPGVVCTRQCANIDSIALTELSLLTGTEEDGLCCAVLHESYGFVLGAVAWIVLTRAELAVYVRALQR